MLACLARVDEMDYFGRILSRALSKLCRYNHPHFLLLSSTLQQSSASCEIVVQALPTSSKPCPSIKPYPQDLSQLRKTRDCSRCTDSHSHPCARRGPPCASSVLHNTSLFHSSIRIIIEHTILYNKEAGCQTTTGLLIGWLNVRSRDTWN